MALAMGPWILYVASFVVLYGAVGPRISYLGVIPVVLVGGLTGMRCGLLAGLLIVPLNILLASISGDPSADFATSGSGLGFGGLALLGATIGWIHDIAVRPALQVMHEARVDAEIDRRIVEQTRDRLQLDLPASGLPDGWAHYVTVLTDECVRIAGLIDGTVRLSHAEVVPGGPTFEPVNLNALADQVVTDYQPQAQIAGNLLVFEPDPNLPLVRGSPEQLEQALSALLDNAVSYTRDGVIYVSTKLVECEAWLGVQDSGVGIDEDEVAHVFERFFRARGATELDVPGAGLGLAIVNEIVSRHGGTIDVKTGRQEGSLFTLRLPLGDAAA